MGLSRAFRGVRSNDRVIQMSDEDDVPMVKITLSWQLSRPSFKIINWESDLFSCITSRIYDFKYDER